MISGVAIGVVGGHTPIDPITGKSGGIGDKRKITKVCGQIVPYKFSFLFFVQRD